MARKLKLLSIIIASLVLALLITMSGVVYWILFYPQSAWNFASKYLLPSDLNITWDFMEFDWHKKTWKEWDFQWSTKNLVIMKGNPELNVGIVTAEAEWALNLFNEKPIFEFARFILQTREKSFFQVPPLTSSSPEKSIYQTINEVVGYLSESNKLAVISTIHVHVADFEVRIPEKKSWTIKGTILKNHEAVNKDGIHFEVFAISKIIESQAKGVLNGDFIGTDQHFLNVEVNAKAPAWSIEGLFQGVFKNGQLSVVSKPKVTVGEGRIPTVVHPDLHLLLSKSSLDLKTQVTVTGIPGPIVHLDKVQASAHVPLQNDVMWSEDPATFKVDTPVDLFLIDKNMRRPLEKACRCKLPEEFQVAVGGKAWLNQFFSETLERVKTVEAHLKLQSVENKLFSADLAGSTEVFREKGEWLFEPNLDARVMIHSFQGVRQYLDAKGVMIPAPLDILEGTISIMAKSPVARNEQSLKTSMQVKVDLKSPAQKVEADAEIIVELAHNFQSMDVDVDAVIRTLKLDLPPLDPVLGIPALASDSRILRQNPQKTKPKFRVRVFSRVRTETAGAIQLASEYAKPFVPLSLKVNSHGSVSTGFIRLEPFTINYLRRKIYVEKVDVSMAKNEEEDLPLAGRFRIEQGGYKIFITLSGTVQAPSIAFSSEPTLTKNDIISVLLYGRVSSELVSAEAETAGNVNAAMADRAVGLFGLWAFASTPIQSFSYNATTKVYTATVDLGNGVAAGVGTNWERATNFELRKRISQRWMLTATWAPNQDNRQEGRLVLQWEKRF